MKRKKIRMCSCAKTGYRGRIHSFYPLLSNYIAHAFSTFQLDDKSFPIQLFFNKACDFNLKSNVIQ
jgi:hypothetical protein